MIIKRCNIPTTNHKVIIECMSKAVGCELGSSSIALLREKFRDHVSYITGELCAQFDAAVQMFLVSPEIQQ